jgi:NADPH:quinone reductase-like Zn-dependent oxidoreductase
MVVKGLYNPKMILPRIPCSDGAGEVWLDGALTRAKSKGALGGDIDGMIAEFVVFKESGLVRIPQHLSFEEAATLPCAAVTAWNALAAGSLKPGSTALILGTGGVSIFALQFARLMGVRVLGISSSNDKLDRAYSLGLSAGLNYRENPDWDRWALDQTGGEGVDLIVEVGGMGTLARSIRAVGFGGVIAQVGVLAGSSDSVPIPSILHKCARIQGIYVGSRVHFEQVNKATSQAQLRPVLEALLWSQARQALTKMELGNHFGKLVLTVA